MIREWIEGYLARLRARFAPGDWPEPGSRDFAEFAKGWITALDRGLVTEREANAASDALLLDPPRFRRDWIPRIVASVEASRRAAPAPQRAASQSHAAWDAAAEANWNQTPEELRDYWRDLVRERLPVLAARPGWLEGLARGWCHDPAMVAGPPPAGRDGPMAAAALRAMGPGPRAEPAMAGTAGVTEPDTVT